jgi:hypothetical protein
MFGPKVRQRHQSICLLTAFCFWSETDNVNYSFVWMLNYHILAQLFRPGAFDMQLYETDESDVVPAHGYLFVMPKISSKGVRATIHWEIEVAA